MFAHSTQHHAIPSSFEKHSDTFFATSASRDISPPPVYEVQPNNASSSYSRYLGNFTHEFDSTLTVPLWKPSPVSIGSVGYVSKETGEFVTFFNALDQSRASDGRIDWLSARWYGDVSSKRVRRDNRHPTKRALDTAQGLVSGRPNSTRRYMTLGGSRAHLLTETTMYRYAVDVSVYREWFSDHVDAILRVYGEEHHIRKDDLIVVVGTLEAPDWAMFVAQEGQVAFDVFSNRKLGQLWGAFATEREVDSQVSRLGSSGLWDTVLIAPLRFLPSR